MDFQALTILTLIGLAAGILSGLVGVGGGIILVPALVYFLGYDQHQAQGTSLGVLTLPVVILAFLTYYKDCRTAGNPTNRPMRTASASVRTPSFHLTATRKVSAASALIDLRCARSRELSPFTNPARASFCASVSRATFCVPCSRSRTSSRLLRDHLPPSP